MGFGDGITIIFGEGIVTPDGSTGAGDSGIGGGLSIMGIRDAEARDD